MTVANLIGAKQAAEICGCSKTTFWTRRKAGRYPEPLLQIGNRPVFSEEEIRAALEKDAAR
jgi:predicted DNA-binding transcriptional regulator AlpA